MVNGDWLTRSVWENYKITILRQGAGQEARAKALATACLKRLPDFLGKC
jgi:hypothetical protein